MPIAKKITLALFFCFFSLFLFSCSKVLAADSTNATSNTTATSGNFNYIPLEKIPGSDAATSTTIDFYSYVSAVYKFGIWAVGIVAMFMIIWGGYTYITSAGNNSQMETAKRIITDAIVGLILALVSYLLLYIINPDLVKMKKLAPVAGVPAPAVPQPPGTQGANCNYTQPAAGQNVCAGASCTNGNCNTSAYDSLIAKYAGINGLDSKLVKSVLCNESSGNPNAVSNHNACGLMQVMPQSGKTCSTDGRGDLTNPETNIKAGTAMLKSLYNQVSVQNYSTATANQMVFAAYNCCANGDNPNAPSNDCGSFVPKWACPINPGTSSYNMCSVKDYVCKISACL